MGGLRPGFVAGGAKDEKVNATLYARISQKTFDEAVKENMEDLEMEPEEALQDAIEQFASQVAHARILPASSMRWLGVHAGSAPHRAPAGVGVCRLPCACAFRRASTCPIS